jgi:hypothetical protein
MAVEEAAPAEKPKRMRAPRKKPVEPVAVEEAAPVEKPRRTRSRKRATPSETDAA